jgi:hypothetical protein
MGRRKNIIQVEAVLFENMDRADKILWFRRMVKDFTDISVKDIVDEVCGDDISDSVIDWENETDIDFSLLNDNEVDIFLEKYYNMLKHVLETEHLKKLEKIWPVSLAE